MLAGAITGLLTLPAFTGSFAQHKPAVKADASTIAALKKEVEKYPDSLPLHKDFINAMTLANPELTSTIQCLDGNNILPATKFLLRSAVLCITGKILLLLLISKK